MRPFPFWMDGEIIHANLQDLSCSSFDRIVGYRLEMIYNSLLPDAVASVLEA